MQTLPWVLISPTIAPDGKHLLVPAPESVLCLSALLPKSATRGSLRGRAGQKEEEGVEVAVALPIGRFGTFFQDSLSDRPPSCF